MPGDELAGRIVLITGASRGLGRGMAVEAARRGARVYVTARQPHSSDQAVAEAARAGGTVTAVRCDLTSPADLVGLVDAVLQDAGRIDALVNNAAHLQFEGIDVLAPEAWDATIAVNLTAPWRLAQLVLPGMRARDSGHVINISSAAAVHPAGPPFAPRAVKSVPYGVVKAGLDRMTTGLAQELRDCGVAVCALSPTTSIPTDGALAACGGDMSMFDSEPSWTMSVACALMLGSEPARYAGRRVMSLEVLAEHGVTPPAIVRAAPTSS